MSTPTQQLPTQPAGKAATTHQRPRREALASVSMLAVFIFWTIAFILVSGLLSGGKGGDVGYIKAWLPWLGATALWVLPLIAGLVLGVHAQRKGGGRLAQIGIWLNALALIIVTIPSIIDRLISG